MFHYEWFLNVPESGRYLPINILNPENINKTENYFCVTTFSRSFALAESTERVKFEGF